MKKQSPSGAGKSTPTITAKEAELLRVLQLGAARLDGIIGALGLSNAATRDRLQVVKAKGYAETIKGGRTWSITPEGVHALERFDAENSSATNTVKVGSASLEYQNPRAHGEDHKTPFTGLQDHAGWNELMRLLPIPEFRAMLRLVLATTLLRQRAPTLSPMPWFGLYGATGTGKSTVAECARAIVGGSFFQVGTMTKGEAMGRRSKKAPYTLEQHPTTIRGPITDLDELAEANDATKAGIYALLQSTNHTITIEGETLENKAVVVGTWNPKERGEILPPGSKRRGVFLDSTPFKGRLERAFNVEMIGADIREVLDRHRDGDAPWFDLRDITAPQKLETDADREATRVLCACLVSPSDHPTAALRGLGAAYKVLFGLSSESAALGEVVSDVATVTATRAGEMNPNWREQVNGYRARSVTNASILETSPQDTPEHDLRAQLQRDVELERAQAEVIQRSRHAREDLKSFKKQKLEKAEQTKAAGLQAALEKIGIGAANAGADKLEVLRDMLEAHELEGRQLCEEIRARLEQTERHKAHQREQILERRKQQAALKKVQGQRVKAQKVERKKRTAQVKAYRQEARQLRLAMKNKDAKKGSVAAKQRQRVTVKCQRVWLEKKAFMGHRTKDKHWGEVLVQGAVDLVKVMQLSGTTQWHDKRTGDFVPDLDLWMSAQAGWLESQADGLEREPLQVERVTQPQLVTSQAVKAPLKQPSSDGDEFFEELAAMGQCTFKNGVIR
jgi:hypothetical protein